MPIHVYRCINCAHEVERLTRVISAPVAPFVVDSCPSCYAKTRHMKTVSAPAVHTERTAMTAQRQAYARKNPNWKQNVLTGKTADGRQLGMPDREGKIVPNLVRKSNAEWGRAFADSHPDLEESRKEVDGKRKSG